MTFLAAATSNRRFRQAPPPTPLPALDITTLTYVETSDTMQSELQGFTLNGDGTKIQAVGLLTATYSYSLATAYDLTSTLTSDGSASAPSGYQKSAQWDPTGTMLFVPHYQNSRLERHDFVTPYDILSITSTASNVSPALLATPAGVHISSDGTKAICVWGAASRCYDMSTPWDLSTINNAVYTELTYSLGGQGAEDCVMSEDGTVGWWLSTNTTGSAGNQIIHQYEFSTAWDLSTGTKNGTTLGTNSAEPNATSLHLEQARQELYVGYYATPGQSDCIVEKYTWT